MWLLRMMMKVAWTAALSTCVKDQYHSTLDTPMHSQFFSVTCVRDPQHIGHTHAHFSSVTCVQDQYHRTLDTPMYAQFSSVTCVQDHYNTLGTPMHAQLSPVTCVQDQHHDTLGTPMLSFSQQKSSQLTTLIVSIRC
jgi:hypothetical protein